MSILTTLTCGLYKPSKDNDDDDRHQQRTGLSDRNLRSSRNQRNQDRNSASPRRSHHLPRLSHFRHSHHHRDSAESEYSNDGDGINTMDDYRIHDSDVAVTRSIGSSRLEQVNTTPTVYRITDSDIDAQYRVNKNKEGDHLHSGDGEGEVSNRDHGYFETGDDSESQSSFKRLDGKGRPIDSPLQEHQRPANYAIVLDGSLSPGFVPAVQ